MVRAGMERQRKGGRSKWETKEAVGKDDNRKQSIHIMRYKTVRRGRRHGISARGCGPGRAACVTGTSPVGPSAPRTRCLVSKSRQNGVSETLKEMSFDESQKNSRR